MLPTILHFTQQTLGAYNLFTFNLLIYEISLVSNKGISCNISNYISCNEVERTTN
jgi:hypothetical protein